MLDCINLSYRQRIVPWLALAFPDKEGTGLVPSLEKFFLRICAFDPSEKPAVKKVVKVRLLSQISQFTHLRLCIQKCAK